MLELRLNVLIFFLQFEAENVLKMFLNYMVYTACISVNQCARDQETYQSALPAEIWYQVACPYLRDLLALMACARCLANQH